MNFTDSLSAAQPAQAQSLEDVALIDIKTVRKLCGFTSSTPIYDRLRAKRFPEPVRLSSRCTRWRMGDVKSYLTGLVAASGAETGAGK